MAGTVTSADAASSTLEAVARPRTGQNSETVPGPAASLWHNRAFNIFWLGQTLSALGDAFAMIAMPLLVLQATGSVAQMGLVTGTMAAAALLAGMAAGPLVDGVNRRVLMILCDVARLLVYLLIPLGWWLAGPQVWLIYVVAGLGSALGTVFGVAYIALVPNLVETAQIMLANGRLQASGGGSFLVGPMLAGVVVAQFSAAAALGIDAVTFLVSALSLSLVRPRAAAPAGGRGEQSQLSQMLAGVRFLWRHPLLRTVTIIYAAVNMALAGGIDLFIFRLKHDLSQSAGTVGLVLGVASLGSIAAGLLAPRMRRRLGYGTCWIGGLLGSGLVLAALAFAGAIPLILPLSVAWVFLGVLMGITNMTLRQEITPDHLLGRVTAAFWTLAGITAPLGAAMSTSLAAVFGVPAVLVGMGCMLASLAVVSLFTPIWHRRPELAYPREAAAMP